MQKKTNPQDDILEALAKARKPLTVAELADATGWAKRTVRAHVASMSRVGGYFTELKGRRNCDDVYAYSISGYGLELAFGRGLTRRRKLTKVEAAA